MDNGTCAFRWAHNVTDLLRSSTFAARGSPRWRSISTATATTRTARAATDTRICLEHANSWSPVPPPPPVVDNEGWARR